MTPQTEQLIRTSGLSAGDKLALRAALASLDLLKVAAVELGCPIDQLDETLLIQQFQIQNDFAPFQRSVKMLRIINPSCCKGFRAVKF